MIVTLAGHVDHGKTSIIKALTGIDTDRLQEEKSRGLTIDLGFAYTDLHGHRVGFVDVPGHHRFVHNMVAGIAAQQYALLVIAADDGVMPQSREHLHILSLLGIEAGVVALSKVDRVEAERIDAVRGEITELIGPTFLQGADILPVSAVTGAGIEALGEHLAAAAAQMRAHVASAPFRLAIDRAFSVRGAGLVVTGTVIAGAVCADDRLLLGTSGQAVRVRGLRTQDADAERAVPGDRAAINLTGADRAARGDWLQAPEAREPVRQFAVSLEVLEDFPRPVKHNAPVHVYHATSHGQGRVLLIEGASMAPGQTGLVDLVVDVPLSVKVGDRLILRDQDLERTLGGGRVIDFEAAPARRRRTQARYGRLASIDPEAPLATLKRLAAAAPVHWGDYKRRWNLAANAEPPDELRCLGDWLFADALAEQIEGDMLHRIECHLRDHPTSTGLTRDLLCSGSPDGREHEANAWRQARAALLDELVVRGELAVQGGFYAPEAHVATVPDDVLEFFDLVQPMLDSTQPPSLGDIAKSLGKPFANLERAMQGLAAHGLAVRVSDNRYYLPGRLGELAEAALGFDGPFTVRQFRDATQVGRNVVIDVLEYFDDRHFTRRDGDMRRVVGTAADMWSG